jgi:hypothetical protein
VLDEEFISMCGQRMWSSVLDRLGGEYAGFATLAHTQEEQCERVLLGQGFGVEHEF